MDDAGGGRRGLRPQLSTELIDAIFERYAIGPISSVVDLGGSSNLNVLVESRAGRHVIRVHRPSVTPERLDAMQTSRRALKGAGIPAATMVETNDGRSWIEVAGRLAEIETFVDSDGRMNSWRRLERGLPFLGRAHTALAPLDIPEPGRDPVFANYLPPESTFDATRTGTDRIRAWGPTDRERRIADQADELAAGLDLNEMQALPRQLVHGDFWDNNVLFRREQVVLVTDLDFMGWRARVEDLALTLYFACFEPAIAVPAGALGAAQLRSLVDAYDTGLDDRLSDAERAALPLALARQPLWSIGVWTACLDDLVAARDHAASMLPALEWASAIVTELDRWQSALA